MPRPWPALISKEIAKTRLYCSGANNGASRGLEEALLDILVDGSDAILVRGSGGVVWRGARVVGCVTRTDRRPRVRG